LSSYGNNQEFVSTLINFAQHAPDKEITIVCKALLAHLSYVVEGTAMYAALQGMELDKVVAMLTSDLLEPMSVHGLSFNTLFSMLNDLAIVAENQRNLVEQDMLSVIGNLVDGLPSQDQESAAKVINTFLQEEFTKTDFVLEDLGITDNGRCCIYMRCAYNVMFGQCI